MSTYTDYKPLNARVDIDFVKKKVSFGYPKGSDKLKYIRRMIEITVYGYSVIIWFLIIVCFGLIVDLITNDTLMQVFYYALFYCVSVGIFYLIDYFIINHIMINYPKYSKAFPKWNHFLVSLFNTSKTVLVRDIKSKTFEIPYTGNVLIEYKAKGDYAKNLKTIHVREYPFEQIKKKGKKYIIDPNMFVWKVIFTFKKIPKNGYMVVKYL